MSPSMYTIRSGSDAGSDTDAPKPPKAVANVLPCRIQHEGPVDSADQFWKPTIGQDGKRTAYFRGKRLNGKEVKLPEGYRGVVVAKVPDATDGTDATAEAATSGRHHGFDEENGEADADVDAGEEVAAAAEGETKIGEMKVQAEFDEMIVWGHETTADASSDQHVRAIEEWLAVADKIHAYEK